nr:putative capsid protein [Takachi virus]BCU46460.1 putative capsid protein [Takachi virus]BCU46466.1 putative capsid protein [Takachi virus]BCU46472.1 putative capsid protein [Takachi virus]BCU46478.1 putative capsid protein [Takachi virus]
MKIELVLAILVALAAARPNDAPDWKKIELLGQQLQSGIAKKNADKTKYYAELIIKELPSQEVTYYAGLRTGEEVSLTAGAAKAIVGETVNLRVNQWTRAVGEYLTIDRHIPGLTLLITGEDVLNDLMEFGWSYRMHPSGHHPVYAATKTLPGKGGKYAGGKTYADKYAAMYDAHVTDAMVAVHPGQADIERMSRHDPINLVFADLTPRSVGGRVEHVLVTKGHYTVQAGKITHVWGDKHDCETCDPNYQVFQ